MLKSKLRDMPVITIHVYPSDKEGLKKKAEARGLKLTTYCRMKLLEDLRKEDC